MSDVILNRIIELEENARRSLEIAATLREELSGGSDSSNFIKPVLSIKHKEAIIAHRRKHRLKKRN